MAAPVFEAVRWIHPTGRSGGAAGALRPFLVVIFSAAQNNTTRIFENPHLASLLLGFVGGVAVHHDAHSSSLLGFVAERAGGIQQERR